jgi:hypothetical protein
MKENGTNQYKKVVKGSKRKRKNRKPHKNTEDSTTKVHFSEYIKKRWNSGKRLPITIRINSDLYRDFKPYGKAVYGSICRSVESFMAACLLTDDEKVHFCHTDNGLNIGKIVIERNLRPRRKLEIADSNDGGEGEALGKCHYCRNPASDRAEYLPTGKIYALCSEHVVSIAYPNRNNWRVLID